MATTSRLRRPSPWMRPAISSWPILATTSTARRSTAVAARGTREASELTRFHAGPSRLRAFDIGEPLADFLHRIRILQGRRVTDLLAGDERADHAAHDLPASGLRQFPRDVDFVRHGDGPDLFPDMVA